MIAVTNQNTIITLLGFALVVWDLFEKR